MPQPLKAPPNLEGIRYFVLRYDRETSSYELCLPNTGNTFLIGKDEQARKYFASVGLAALGERAMGAAQSFGGSQALIGENRAWGLDLTQLPGPVQTADDRLTRARLFSEDDDADDVVVLHTGNAHGTQNEIDKVVLA